MKQETCKQCETTFSCSENGVPGSCWCSSYPIIMPLVTKDETCLCPTCLAKTIALKLESYIDELEHDKILEVAKQYRKKKQLIEHIDYYLENDFYVFTRWFHLKRGACCGSGCRHCPYKEFDKEFADSQE